MHENAEVPNGLAWLWFVVTSIISLTALFLFGLNAGTIVPASWGAAGGARDGFVDWLNSFQQALVAPLIVSALGVLIVTQRPGQRIGRLFVVLGLVNGLSVLTQEWAVFGYYTAGVDLPAVNLTAWITNWIWIVLLSLLLLTAALFPDGQFLSHRWRILIGGCLFLFAAPFLFGAMIETRMSSVFQIPNPYLNSPRTSLYTFLSSLGVAFMPLTAVAVLVAAIARFRLSRRRERQRMKWLLAGVAVMAALIVIGLGINFGLGYSVGAVMVNTAVLGPILGAGIALVRHQLYDIDVIIRRTLVYSALTALLVSMYLGGVVLLQIVFRNLTGQESQLAIVISTLGIVALFNPSRRRVQQFIDRRFYRRRYDAEQLLASFAETVRDEVDLNRLAEALPAVVEDAIQPAHVSLWLAEPDVD